MFFLEGVRQQATDALLTIQKLLALKDEYEKIARGPKVPKAVNPLIDSLFGRPIISISELVKVWKSSFPTVSELVKVWKSSFPTVQRGVDYLIERGKLREITGRQRNRLFVADEIVDAIMTDRAKSIR